MPPIILSPGDDTFYGGNTAESIFGVGGNDFLVGGGGSDTLFGGLGDDTLQDGSAGDTDTYYGGAGNDIIQAGFGDFGDLADGGTGTDMLSLYYAFFTQGGLSIIFGSSFFVLAGGAQGISAQNFEALQLSGTAQGDFVQCAGGDDYILAGDGFDTLYGGGGNDYFDVGNGDFLVAGGAGIDTFAIILSAVTVAVQWTVGPSATLAIAGFSGTATGMEIAIITTGTGNDSLVGGAYADRFNTGLGNDLLDGGQGNDMLSSGNGSDLIYGGAGNDFITNYFTFEVGTGGDTAYGGLGNDSIYGADRDEVLHGGDGDDVINGSYGLDVIYGGNGNDFLNGTTQCSLYGGAGDDRVSLIFDDIVDVLSGGTGVDRLAAYLNFNLRSHTLETRQAAGGYQFLDNGVVVQTATGFESFTIGGGEMGDTLRGGALDDVLTGYNYDGPASDADRLFGNAGNDLLIGRAADDRLYGGDDADTLDGGLDKDQLSGGLGADVFRLTRELDSGVGNALRDVIADFVAGQDRIDLSQIDAAPLDALIDAFTFIGRTAFGNHAGELRFAGTLLRTIVQGDTDGDGSADFEIELTGKVVLQATDFIL